MNVTVLSAGTWGITLAVLLAKNNHHVNVWEYSAAVVDELLKTRSHPKLAGLEIPGQMQITVDLGAALENAEVIVCVVPAAHVRETSKSVKSAGYGGQPFVVCSKGIEQHTNMVLADVVAEELGSSAEGKIAVLSGPSHAEEVSRGVPTAVTAAAVEISLAETVRDLFRNDRFRIYTQTDMLGVELASALKNVIAIACGISDGLGFGDNPKAALITRGLSEIIRLGTKMGAQQETFVGLAGVGDLVVTCMSKHSRNWKFGNLLGQGHSAEDALEKVGMVVEGHYTVISAVELSKIHGVDMPITEAVSSVLFDGKSPHLAVTELMLRDSKSELDD